MGAGAGVGPKTTISDVPIEIFEDILLHAVAMEVKSMKFAKSAWRVKSSTVIQRLSIVCTSWRNILTSHYFTNSLHRLLQTMEPNRIQVVMMQEVTIPSCIHFLAVVNKDVLLLCSSGIHSYHILVAALDDLSNLSCAFLLPDGYPVSMVGESERNCLYVTHKHTGEIAVLKVTKNIQDVWNARVFLKNLHYVYVFDTAISCDNHSLIILAEIDGGSRIFDIFDSQGNCTNQFTIRQIYVTPGDKMICTPIGDVIIVSSTAAFETLITEVNFSGKVINQYISLLNGGSTVSYADRHGRLVILSPDEQIQLLDSEMNEMEIVNGTVFPHNIERLFFDGETMLGVKSSAGVSSVLTRLRLTET